MTSARDHTPLVSMYEPPGGDAGDGFEVIVMNSTPINAIAFGMKAVPVKKIIMADGSSAFKATVPAFESTRWTDISVPLYLLEVQNTQVQNSWYMGAFRYSTGDRSMQTTEFVSEHIVFVVDPKEMALNWDDNEIENNRRLVKIEVEETNSKIECRLSKTTSSVDGLPVISCIRFGDDHFVTSVDIIVLLEALFQSQFTIDVKNRIRRNLEKLQPRTLSKTKQESVTFFRLIMDFDDPKPRNIEKDIKVFRWSDIPAAVEKIFSKTLKTHDGIVFI